MTHSSTNYLPPTGIVRVGSIAAIPNVLMELGFDPEKILAKLAFDASKFQNPDQFITIEERSKLLSQCALETKCMHFGLLVGRSGGLSSLGLIGLLAQQSSDVGTALQNLIRYFHLNARGAGIYMEENDNEVFFGYSMHVHNVVGRLQTEDGANALAYAVLRELCGPEWQPIQVLSPHYEPLYINPYRDYFKVPIVFNAGRNGLLFSRKWLKYKLPGATPALLKLIQAEVDRNLTLYGLDFEGHIRSVLANSLFSHNSTAEHIASLFSMHSRTLHRRLGECGTNFKKVSEEVRFEIARQLLEDSSISLTSIADVLNFSSPTAFSRAFRRWSGIPPSRWREINSYKLPIKPS